MTPLAWLSRVGSIERYLRLDQLVTTVSRALNLITDVSLTVAYLTINRLDPNIYRGFLAGQVSSLFL
jgi:hypothetical protein